ncbi:hypothetical protein I4F81_004601 [Pyropia yezoensis]|uniref:Uncharacterized protein n=1 Tax=Pyropia yezoensis TaxID=2788 RepID=A0ACC3BWA1_PYRYE|nr:hypothetical protein I4F81_004601 [Neopyropia yezoensis]
MGPPALAPFIITLASPLSRVRWLPPGAAFGGPATPAAVLAVGTASGDAGGDFVALYAATAVDGVASVEPLGGGGSEGGVPHPGRVAGLVPAADGAGVHVASAAGSLATLWQEDDGGLRLEPTGRLPGAEAAVGVAVLSGGGVALAGAHGTVGLFDPAGGGGGRGGGGRGGGGDPVAAVRHVDPVGATAAAAAGPQLVAVAGVAGGVALVDSRAPGVTGRLGGVGGGLITCLVGDVAAPAYLLGGTEAGELVVWDRRYAAPPSAGVAGGAGAAGDGGRGEPLARTRLHAGPLWEVALSAGGTALTAGEDGLVYAVDFAAASRAGVLGGGGTGGGGGRMGARGARGGGVWEAPLSSRHVRLLAGGRLGVNSVDVHGGSGLVAWCGDGGGLAVSAEGL